MRPFLFMTFFVVELVQKAQVMENILTREYAHNLITFDHWQLVDPVASHFLEGRP